MKQLFFKIVYINKKHIILQKVPKHSVLLHSRLYICHRQNRAFPGVWFSITQCGCELALLLTDVKCITDCFEPSPLASVCACVFLYAPYSAFFHNFLPEKKQTNKQARVLGRWCHGCFPGSRPPHARCPCATRGKSLPHPPSSTRQIPPRAALVCE